MAEKGEREIEKINKQEVIHSNHRRERRAEMGRELGAFLSANDATSWTARNHVFDCYTTKRYRKSAAAQGDLSISTE